MAPNSVGLRSSVADAKATTDTESAKKLHEATTQRGDPALGILAEPADILVFERAISAPRLDAAAPPRSP